MAVLSYPLLKGIFARVEVDLRTGRGFAYAAEPWQQWFYEIWQRVGGPIGSSITNVELTQVLELGDSSASAVEASRESATQALAAVFGESVARSEGSEPAALLALVLAGEWQSEVMELRQGQESQAILAVFA